MSLIIKIEKFRTYADENHVFSNNKQKSSLKTVIVTMVIKEKKIQI